MALQGVSKPTARPPIMTFLGDAGVGKTSFAALFPNPIVIRAEDGVGRISQAVNVPDAFELPESIGDVQSQLMQLLNEEHDYKTVIFDSITAYDTLSAESILKQDGKATTLARAFGGYGAGLEAQANNHALIRKLAGRLNKERNMWVIFIAHADLETVKLPDQEDYARYSLRLSKKSLTHYIDNVDLVGLIRIKSILRGGDDERKRVLATSEREFLCHANPASVTKNGFGITEPLELEEGVNPLLPIIRENAKRFSGKVEVKPDPTPTPEPEENGIGEPEDIND